MKRFLSRCTASIPEKPDVNLLQTLLINVSFGSRKGPHCGALWPRRGRLRPRRFNLHGFRPHGLPL